MKCEITFYFEPLHHLIMLYSIIYLRLIADQFIVKY